MSGEPLGRREVLSVLARWSAGVAAILVPGAGCRSGPLLPANALVVGLARVPPGTVLATTLGKTPVLVLNLGGRIRALSGYCTHESCELGWNRRQQLIRCPCHGSAFTPDGRVKSGPATEPLPEYPVEVRGTRLVIEVRPSS